MTGKSEAPFQYKPIPWDEKEVPRVYIDDVLMTLKYFVDEENAHLRIISQEVCAQCDKPCLHFCPVGVYRLDEMGKIQVAYQACVECGSCRLMCPPYNLEWRLPRGGFGVAYKFG
jgi:ferredoxin like protein